MLPLPAKAVETLMWQTCIDLGDLIQSIAVLIAGLVIMWKPEWSVIDPILSIIFCPIISTKRESK